MNLENIYDRETFLEFINSFLPDFSKDAREIGGLSLQFNGVKSLGHSSKLDLQVFEVEVKGSIDKRVSIATDAFKLMKTTASYRSLVAFYSSETDQWRLSLMTAQPTIENGKVITKLSSPRRYSYLLGPGSKLNTPSKQLILKGKVTDFDDLSKRFAVEVVNNEFYKEIAKLYDELVGTDKITGVLKYPGQGEASHEFAVRLIGRIIFCWFLREKRSELGTPLISTKVLSRTAANKSNYYHSELAPLFFEVLNKHLRSREEKFQSKEYASIPYLNGGLFSPDYDDHYRFDKSLQLSVPGLVDIPDAWLHKLFDLLELYNFTVDENTSYDIDLSIDPEMLGRIFENLLARINPETGETVRKSTGSFYTPREIVEYMVDESLKEYLKTETGISESKLDALASFDLSDDEEHALDNTEKVKITNALSRVKVLDPACGSGAFPIGILQKIVFMLQQVDPNAKLWFEKQLSGASPEFRHHLEREYKNRNFDYLRKLGVIRESIYGVDIQPIATEISRLRCFLTLVVDQSVDDDEQNRGVEPLPNLDFKFVTANSLIKLGEVAPDQSSQTGLFEDRSGIDELRILRDEYFTSHNSDRESLKMRFTQVQKKMLQKMLEQRSGDFAGVTSKLSAWDPFSHGATTWFDPEWMFGISTGFDVVIANPPYVSASKIGELKDFYRSQSDVAHGSYDLFIIFFERGLEYLKSGGVLSYISSNKYFIADYAVKLREFIFRKSEILQIINLADCKRVFESAAVSAAITLLRRSTPKSDSYLVKVKNLKDRDLELISSLRLDKVSANQLVSGHNLAINIDLTNLDVSTVVSKLEKDSVSLGKIAEVRTGVMGFEYWNMEPYVSELNQHGAVKLVTNGLISPYEFPEHKTINLYKKKYINPFLDLENAPLSSSTKELFKSPKIIVRGVSRRLVAAHDNEGRAMLVAVHSIQPKNDALTMYILALLNSKLFNWYHIKKFYAARIPEGSLKYPISFLKHIPFRIDDKVNVEKISRLAEKLISSHDEDFIAKIDQAVYELYGLTQDEIKIIEEQS